MAVASSIGVSTRRLKSRRRDVRIAVHRVGRQRSGRAPTRATIAITVSAIVGVAMYASAFVWLGLVSTQAIAIGLLYIVLWEGFFSGFVSGVRLLSIRHYAIALMHALDTRRFAASNHLNAGVSIAVAALVIGGLLHLLIRRLRRMDVP